MLSWPSRKIQRYKAFLDWYFEVQSGKGVKKMPVSGVPLGLAGKRMPTHSGRKVHRYHFK